MLYQLYSIVPVFRVIEPGMVVIYIQQRSNHALTAIAVALISQSKVQHSAVEKQSVADLQMRPHQISHHVELALFSAVHKPVAARKNMRCGDESSLTNTIDKSTIGKYDYLLT